MMIPAGVSFPLCLADFERNLADVGRLLEIGPTTRGESDEPRKTSEVINRAAVVLGCASWEAYIEDLVIESLNFLVCRYQKGNSLAANGQEVAVRASRQLRLAKVRPGDVLAMRAKREGILGIFNTPKSTNIDSLFERTLDLPSLSTSWRWNRTSAATMRQAINEFVAVRGDIAHRTKGPHQMTRSYVSKTAALLERAALLSYNRVRSHLTEAAGAPFYDSIPLSAVK